MNNVWALKPNYLCYIFAVFLYIHACENVSAQSLTLKPSSLSEAELNLWNSDDFKRRFTESYIAETDIEPLVTVPEREIMTQILELISENNLDHAAQLLLESRNEASSAVLDYTLGNIYFQQDKLDEAVPEYIKATEKFHKFRRAWKNIGIIYIRQAEFAKALPALTKVVELGGHDAVTYGLLGYAYSSVENFLSAESAYRMAILLDPVTMDWKMGLTRSFFKQERFAEAAALCKQLILEQPGKPDVWLLQANAFIGLNQPMKAAENYEIVDQLGKSTVDSLYMLGDIYINQELYDIAANTYIRAFAIDEEKNTSRPIRSAKILASRGAMEETSLVVDQIQSTYNEQLTTDDKKDLLKIQARLAVANGSEGEEVQVLKEIVELDPLDGEALILLGQHSSRTGDNEQAVFYYELAANIDDYEADAKVRHAQLLVKTGKYAEALPLLRRAQQINQRENIQDYLEQVERLAKSN